MQSEELCYSKDMWDKLIPINQQNKHGIAQLHSLKTFSREFQRLVSKFSKDMHFAIQKWDRQNGTSFFPNQQNTTVAMACDLVQSGVFSMCQALEECSQQIVGDLVEPLETFTKLHTHDSQDTLQTCSQNWDTYVDYIKESIMSRDRLFDLKQDVEKYEVRLEEAMLALERGQTSSEHVQRVCSVGT